MLHTRKHEEILNKGEGKIVVNKSGEDHKAARLRCIALKVNIL